MKIEKNYYTLTIFLLLFFLLNNSLLAQESPITNEEIIKVNQPLFEEKNTFEKTIKEEELEKQQKTSKFKSYLKGSYLTGNWGGARTKLEEKGIYLELYYTNDFFMKLHGGLNKKTLPKSLGLLDFGVTLNTEEAGLWKGGEFHVLGENLHGHGLSNTQVGDWQYISSIDAPGMTQLSEYWYKQSLFSDKFALKIGKQDANYDFTKVDLGWEFVHSSFYYIPTAPIPFYPNQALGVSAFLKPIEEVELKAGVYDGEANGGTMGFNTTFDGNGGVFSIVELSLKPTIKKHPGNYIFGYWNHSGNFDEITLNAIPRTYTSNQGFYASFQQMLFKEHIDDDEDDQGLSVMGQYGWAPGNRNEVSRYYGGGLVYKGMFPHRKNDTAGIGFAMADFSNRYKISDGMDAETALEIFYKFQITPFLALQPDFQYIFNPYGLEKNALVIGIRTLLTF